MSASGATRSKGRARERESGEEQAGGRRERESVGRRRERPLGEGGEGRGAARGARQPGKGARAFPRAVQRTFFFCFSGFRHRELRFFRANAVARRGAAARWRARAAARNRCARRWAAPVAIFCTFFRAGFVFFRHGERFQQVLATRAREDREGAVARGTEYVLKVQRL